MVNDGDELARHARYRSVGGRSVNDDYLRGRSVGFAFGEGCRERLNPYGKPLHHGGKRDPADRSSRRDGGVQARAAKQRRETEGRRDRVMVGEIVRLDENPSRGVEDPDQRFAGSIQARQLFGESPPVFPFAFSGRVTAHLLRRYSKKLGEGVAMISR